ncbi:MAG TPA: 50S ribosomal protein L22 [Candidatus Woesebacteria bacterium]|nr:50S ribosomal protein L22 [Candidatus Woesebacteria bacterium]
MIIKAEQKNTRQPARKVRLVADVVKEMSIIDAIKQLAVINRKSSLLVLKVLRQAIANATNNFGLAVDDLEIDSIVVNDGPALKRWRAVSRGRAHTILKRTCHVRVNLKTKENIKPVSEANKLETIETNKDIKNNDKLVTKPEAEESKETKESKEPKESKEINSAVVKKSREAIKLDRSKSQAVKAKVTGIGQANKLIQSQKKGSK